MKSRTDVLLAGTGILLMACSFTTLSIAQNMPAVHWVNDSGQHADEILNSGAVFVTSFKTTNDVTIARLTQNAVRPAYLEFFGGAMPGNNPWYLTQFTGTENNGTGNGVAGSIRCLLMTKDSTGSLQFDFLSPLTSHDRILIIDVDGMERYLLQAYVFDGSSYQLVGLANWGVQLFSGSTGALPDSRWPVWNPTTGTVTAGSGNPFLNEDIFVLTPDRNIDRFVIIKQAEAFSGSCIQFCSPPRVPLSIQAAGTNVVLSWSSQVNGMMLSNVTAFATSDLQTGIWTNVSGVAVANEGSWVLTNVINSEKRFYRLQGP